MLSFVINLCFIMKTDERQKRRTKEFLLMMKQQQRKKVYTQVERYIEDKEKWYHVHQERKAFEEEKHLSICVCVLLLY